MQQLKEVNIARFYAASHLPNLLPLIDKKLYNKVWQLLRQSVHILQYYLKNPPKQQQPQPHFQLSTEDLDCAETTIQQNLSTLQTKLKVRNVCTNSKIFFITWIWRFPQ